MQKWYNCERFNKCERIARNRCEQYERMGYDTPYLPVLVDVLEEKGYTGYLESYFDSLFNEITGEDINEYLCQGYTYREIAEYFNVSFQRIDQVMSDIKNILKKSNFYKT